MDTMLFLDFVLPFFWRVHIIFSHITFFRLSKKFMSFVFHMWITFHMNKFNICKSFQFCFHKLNLCRVVHFVCANISFKCNRIIAINIIVHNFSLNSFENNSETCATKIHSNVNITHKFGCKRLFVNDFELNFWYTIFQIQNGLKN